MIIPLLFRDDKNNHIIITRKFFIKSISAKFNKSKNMHNEDIIEGSAEEIKKDNNDKKIK